MRALLLSLLLLSLLLLSLLLLPCAAAEPAFKVFKPSKFGSFKKLGGPKVELLTAVWCGQCKNAKKWLDAKGVAYRELDIEKDAEGKQRYKDGGIRGVPIAYFDGTAVVGYSPKKYEEMLAR